MDFKMNSWSKYKNYIFTSINSIKTVHVISESKTYFCFDDMMSLIGYKLDDNGSVNRQVTKRYFNRLKMQNFIEIYPNNLFVSVDHIKNLPSLVGLLANSPTQQTNLNTITVKLLRSFLDSFKNRKEEIIEDNIEDFINIRNRLFSVATYKNKTVIKASDILRYCGYKNTKVPDNFKEHSVKINTKNGISNFVYLEKFPFIANEMINSNYSKKMNSLFIAFQQSIPAKNKKTIIDKDSSTIVYGTNIIPFVLQEGNIYFQSLTIQKICGYYSDKLQDNFKNNSIKFNDVYFISLESIKKIINSRINSEYKENLKSIYNSVIKFS